MFLSRELLELAGEEEKADPDSIPLKPMCDQLASRESALMRLDPVVLCILQRYTKVVAKRTDPLDGCVGFEWDEGNAHKNWERHRVSPQEAEDLFFNEPLVIRSDVRHSRHEKRYYALGQTRDGRYLFAAFTIRRSLLRVISVRDMNQKEREEYASREEDAGT